MRHSDLVLTANTRRLGRFVGSGAGEQEKGAMCLSYPACHPYFCPAGEKCRPSVRVRLAQVQASYQATRFLLIVCSDAERKTTYEAAQHAIKYNQGLMRQLKEENALIRNQLKELKKNKILTAPEHIQKKVRKCTRSGSSTS